MDTGSDLSILPVSYLQRQKASDMVLYAANNTRIVTYGIKRLNFNLGLRKDLSWNFCVADIRRPIVGADFLSHFGLMVDLKNRRLVDENTKMYSRGKLRIPPLFNVSTIDNNDPFAEILREFPEVTALPQEIIMSSHGVFHHIHSSGFATCSTSNTRKAKNSKRSI